MFALLLCISVYAKDEPTVYVSGFGDDSNPGTKDLPLRTLEAGFHSLPFGGKLVMVTAFTLGETTNEFPEVDGLITLTSYDGITDYREVYGAKLYFVGNLMLRGNMKFENIDFISCEKDRVIICNGHYACFGEGIRTSTINDSINHIGITGGGSRRHPAKGAFIEIHSGDWHRIRGGKRNTSDATDGDVTVAIYGGTIYENCWLAGDALTNGNGYLYIYGGTFKKGVQLANTTGFTGNIHASIYGGEFHAPIYVSKGGNVGGNVTVNVLKNAGAEIIFESGSIKSAKVQLANASFAYVKNIDAYVINSEKAEEIKLSDAENIRFTKENLLATKYSIPIHLRNMTEIKSVYAQNDTQIYFDTNGDQKINLKDALEHIKAKKDIGDAVLIINSIAGVENIFSSNINLGEIKLYGAEFEQSVLTKGFAFADAKKNNYTVYSDVTLNENGIIGLFFGCDRPSPVAVNGYYFEVSLERSLLNAYSVSDGKYRCLGAKKLDLLSNEARIYVEYIDGVSNLYFDDNPLEVTQFFDFNFNLEPHGTYIGMYVENASANAMRASETIKESSDNTFTNELLYSFTDPDIFCENGVYYIYGSGNGTGEGKSGGINCFSTIDFVDFKYEGQVLKKGDTFGESGFLCANIVKCGSYYYMFYSAYDEEFGRSPTACASSTSPTGPFTNPDMKPLANIPDMLGGQPFVDDDGTVYLIYTRTAGGNQTYGTKVILKNGKAELDLESEKFLLGITEPWEAARANVVECGLIVKHNGLYYLLYAGGNYNSSYGVGYATSENPLGPYTKYEHNPVMIGTAQSYGVGAASVFPSADGSEYFIIYLRHFSYSSVRPLQTGMDRFRFVKNPKGGADIIEICGPSVTAQPIPSAKGSISADEWQSVRFHP